jgi:Cdc6-like AAA superfamily ATPase
MGPETGQPPAEVTEEVESSPEESIQAAYGKALDLIAAAARADRTIEERIGDYRRALDSLQSVGASAPTDLRPADLPDLIERVEKELERLRLKEFFG